MQIEISQITKIYPGGKRALDDISLHLETPAFIGLLGPNGAGKSTLMKLLTLGLLPTSGQITLDGAPLRSREKSLKQRLGYLPQEFGLYEELTVEQFLDYMCAMKGIAKDASAQIDKVVGFSNLEEKRTSRISRLSGGFKQRVAIAQAMLGEPELLIFDEPTVGLDPEERLSFRNRFSEAARNRVVILSTHIIEDIQSVCNRLVVLHHGRILYDGAPEGLLGCAQGHVGVWQAGVDAPPLAESPKYRVTSRVIEENHTLYRIVAESLPGFARPAVPTLEDAYMLLCAKAEGGL